jgi:uncharacterized membrane protein SpoIIM required for sporulation
MSTVKGPATSSDRALQSWLTSRTATWQSLLATLDDLEGRRDHPVADVLHAVELYHSLGRDLAIARNVLPASRMTLALEQSYARLHAIIHRQPHNWRDRLRRLFGQEIPQAMRDMRFALLAVSLLFVLSAGAGWWLISRYPELVGLLASEKMISGVETGRLWTEDMLNVAPSSVVSIGILSNNIAVSVFAYCLGVFFGLGTFYIIAVNGLMLGGVFAFTHQYGMSDELLRFVIAHGFVELSIICVAGAAGVALGSSLMWPTHATRRESFQHAAGKTVKVMIPCALLLVGCGFIEGYLSPDPNFPMLNRWIVGLGFWVVMIGVFSGTFVRSYTRLRRRSSV